MAIIGKISKESKRKAAQHRAIKEARRQARGKVTRAKGTFSKQLDKKRSKQPDIVSATPEALKVLQDLAAGKGGRKHKKSARKELSKIRFIRPSEGSFRRLSATQAKSINKKLSQQLKQRSVIRSPEGIFRVNNQFFASKRAAEIYIDDILFKQKKKLITSLVKKQAVPQLLKKLFILTPQEQLRVIINKANQLQTKAKKVSFLNKAINKLDFSIEKRKKLVSEVLGVEKLKARPKFGVGAKGKVRLEKALTKQQLKKLSKKEKRRKELVMAKKVGKVALTTSGIITLGLAKGIIGALKTIRHPVQTFTDIKKEVKRIGVKRVFLDELTRFGQNPFGVIAEYKGFSKTFNVAGSTIKGSKFGQALAKEVFIFRTPKQLRSSVRAVLNAVERQKGIKIKKINPRQIKALKVSELNNVEVAATLQAMKKVNGVLFGSAAARILSKGRTKIPKDLDIAIPVSPVKFAKEFIKRVPKNQRKLYRIKGEKIIKRGDRAFKIDVKPISRLIPSRNFFTRKGKLPIAGVRLVSKLKQDIKKFITLKKEIASIKVSLKIPGKTVKAKALLNKRLKLKIKQVNKIKRGLKLSELPKKTRKIFEAQLTLPTERLVKIEGIKLIGFSEQTTRKALGTLQVLLEKNLRRAKDPQAFVESLQVQVQILKSQKPKTFLGKALKRRKIKKIQDSINILTSKKFQRLLEKQVKGITKDFPILKRLSIPRLKKTKKLSLTNLKKKLKKTGKSFSDGIKKGDFAKLGKDFKFFGDVSSKLKKRIQKQKTKKSKKKIPKRKSKLPSRLPKSKLPISKLPLSRLSRMPPSKIPKSILVKASKLPPVKLSKLPVNILSHMPPSVLSKLPPSKLKTVLSKLPPAKISKLPSSILKKAGVSKLPKAIKRPKPKVRKPIKKKEEERKKKIVKKYLESAKKFKKGIYISDLAANLLGEKAKGKKARVRLLDPKTVFTGFERRLIV